MRVRARARTLVLAITLVSAAIILVPKAYVFLAGFWKIGLIEGTVTKVDVATSPGYVKFGQMAASTSFYGGCNASLTICIGTGMNLSSTSP